MSVGKTALKVFGTSMAVLGPVFTYNDMRSSGHGVLYSAAGAAASELLYATPLGWGLVAGNIAKMGVEGGMELGRNSAYTQSKSFSANFGGNHRITTNGNTLRQRGLQAINNSNANVRSVLGSEARSYYRGNSI